MAGTTLCSTRGQGKSQIMSSVANGSQEKRWVEGNHLFKTHETWNFLFAIKEERGSVKM